MYSHVLGIPGCAKSALCKEMLSAPGGLGDDPPVNSLMGDLIKGMEQSNSKGRENMKLPEIIELNDTAQKGKVLCFPKTIVKYHNQNNATGELKLTIHRPMSCPLTLCVHLKELHMHILSSRQRNFDAIQHPSLGPPPYHSQDIEIILRKIISERINQREIKWESSLSSCGEASYLSKFWEWYV
ncbi:tRNA ligase [Abeliophyllum distichum]|uniref:tRNA ligase n=1 Tax=Abeliophyllum distichum TaxID=126358 RepID=A0ABD1Q5P1_9LAMI